MSKTTTNHKINTLEDPSPVDQRDTITGCIGISLKPKINVGTQKSRRCFLLREFFFFFFEIHTSLYMCVHIKNRRQLS